MSWRFPLVLLIFILFPGKADLPDRLQNVLLTWKESPCHLHAKGVMLSQVLRWSHFFRLMIFKLKFRVFLYYLLITRLLAQLEGEFVLNKLATMGWILLTCFLALIKIFQAINPFPRQPEAISSPSWITNLTIFGCCFLWNFFTPNFKILMSLTFLFELG